MRRMLGIAGPPPHHNAFVQRPRLPTPRVPPKHLDTKLIEDYNMKFVESLYSSVVGMSVQYNGTLRTSLGKNTRLAIGSEQRPQKFRMVHQTSTACKRRQAACNCNVCSAAGATTAPCCSTGR